MVYPLTLQGKTLQYFTSLPYPGPGPGPAVPFPTLPYLHGHVDSQVGVKVPHLHRFLLADTPDAADSLRVNLRVEPAI